MTSIEAGDRSRRGDTSKASSSNAPTPWVRAAAGLIIAASAGSLIAAHGRYYGARGMTGSDYDQVWIASRAILNGADPYAAAAEFWYWGTQYQPPAFLLNLPLALIPLEAARLLFFGLSTAALVYGMTRHSWSGLLTVATGCFLVATLNVQWTPLLMAGVFFPVLATAWIAKPSLGLALWVAWPSRCVAAAALILLVIGTALVPGWYGDWSAKMAEVGSHIRPAVSRPFGWLLLLAFLRWRRPEARLLGVLALVPHTETWYDLLILFLIPNGWGERTLLAALSVVGLWLAWRVTDLGDPTVFGSVLNRQWPIMLGLMYLPALVMVLRRSNEGELPAWITRLAPQLFNRLGFRTTAAAHRTSSIALSHSRGRGSSPRS